MRTISAADANRQFSQMLREVRKGETFIVTSHGTPVATLAPVAGDLAARERAKEALLARLESQPAQNLGPWTRDELYDDDPSAEPPNPAKGLAR